MNFGVLDIDFGVEFKLNMVGNFLGFTMAGEGKAGGLEVDRWLFAIRCSNGKGDVVSLGVRGGRALGPDHWTGLLANLKTEKLPRSGCNI